MKRWSPFLPTLIKPNTEVALFLLQGLIETACKRVWDDVSDKRPCFHRHICDMWPIHTPWFLTRPRGARVGVGTRREEKKRREMQGSNSSWAAGTDLSQYLKSCMIHRLHTYTTQSPREKPEKNKTERTTSWGAGPDSWLYGWGIGPGREL